MLLASFVVQEMVAPVEAMEEDEMEEIVGGVVAEGDTVNDIA